MSDTSYPVFQRYGTHAQRLAFTPSPPSGAQPIYIWYETDTGAAFLYDTSWHQITSVGALPSSVQGDTFYASAVNTVVALAKDTNATRYYSNQGTSNNPSWNQVNLANGVTGTLPKANQGAGTSVQVVNTQTGAVATGSTIIPLDDTTPQITEGDEYMTLAITPTNASNKLRIEVIAQCSNGSAFTIIGALFQDSTANALASCMAYDDNATGMRILALSLYMTAGTTSSTTFRFRIGTSNAATITFNGFSGARKLGGSMSSSITITEIAV
jgi:hypothetical protein